MGVKNWLEIKKEKIGKTRGGGGTGKEDWWVLRNRCWILGWWVRPSLEEVNTLTKKVGSELTSN